jgi:hypothetical protein
MLSKSPGVAFTAGHLQVSYEHLPTAACASVLFMHVLPLLLAPPLLPALLTLLTHRRCLTLLTLPSLLTPQALPETAFTVTLPTLLSLPFLPPLQVLPDTALTTEPTVIRVSHNFCVYTRMLPPSALPSLTPPHI